MKTNEIDEIFNEMLKEDGKEPIIKSNDIVVTEKMMTFLEKNYPPFAQLLKDIVDLIN